MSNGEPDYKAPDWTASFDPQALDAMYHKMLQIEGPEMGFALSREIADERTFSPEAIDEVLAGMRAWFYSRLSRAWAEGRAAKQAVVTVRIDLK